MSCYARLENFKEAEASLLRARQFYALHVKLPDEQRAEFVQTGCFIGELQPAGDRDLQENPWLYFILGHVYGPSLPGRLEGETESERHAATLKGWGNFFDDPERVTGALAYLLASKGRNTDAAKYFEKLSLMARKYEMVSPVRIEVLWPYVMLGECYRAGKQEAEAARAWRSAGSVELCISIDPDIDDCGQFALPWIAKAKSRLAEHNIPVPVLEVSRRASQHLEQAIRCLLQAEEFEVSHGELEEMVTLIRQAGRRYSAPLERAASELEIVERLDPFTWSKSPSKESYRWYRYESVKSFLFQKMAFTHIANDKLALAIASYMQAMELWPMLSACVVMGGLQLACGLVSDARATYQRCIERADEFGAVESSQDCEETLRELREALSELK